MCEALKRAGLAGAIGMGLFACVGAQANTPVPRGVDGESAQTLHLQVASDQALSARSDTLSAYATGLSLSPQIAPWQKITVAAGDSLSSLFANAGIPARDLMAIVDLGKSVAPLKILQPGDSIEIRKTSDGQLSELRYKLDAVDTLAIARGAETQGKPGPLSAHIIKALIQTREIRVAGEVDESLSQSLDRADVPAHVAVQLARIYRYRANLSRNMHAGDKFSLVYEAQFVGSQRVATGPILAADITTGGQSLEAFRATNAHGDPGYYDSDGRSYEPSFSRHPVNYSRISSPFNPHRMHPILHIRRPHWGVDMAARRGTPIHAAAEGTVKFVGRRRGYGRLVELNHFDGYSTRYGHMYKFAKGLHNGEHVTKGEIIGYVGSTGVATGSHLHFEIRKNGVAHNPLTMRLPEGRSLSGTRLARFTSRIQPLIARLENVGGSPETLVAWGANPIRYKNCRRAGTVNASLAVAPNDALDHHSIANLFCVIDAGSGV